MAKFKLTSTRRTVVPDIMLRDEETGEKIKNRSLEPGTRIEADITHANPEEFMQYMGSYTKRTKRTKTTNPTNLTYSDIRMEACIRKHVISIRGCLPEYRDGNTLWDGPESTEKNAIITSLFWRSLGMGDEEVDEVAGEFDNDGPADLTPGEN